MRGGGIFTPQFRKVVVDPPAPIHINPGFNKINKDTMQLSY